MGVVCVARAVRGEYLLILGTDQMVDSPPQLFSRASHCVAFTIVQAILFHLRSRRRHRPRCRAAALLGPMLPADGTGPRI
jgi:hypothetical protein